MFKAVTSSWKTTTVAILLAVDAGLHAAMALMDNDPLTVPDWNMVVVLVVAAVGMLFARDANVSSQDAEIRQ